MLPTNKKWWALIGLGLGVLILNIDTTILNIALPVIGHQFHANIRVLSWINNIYVLVFSCIVIVIGRFADFYGAKPIYCIGTAIFAVGSFIAGVAPDTAVIIFGRMVQGAGMAMVFPMSVILSNQIFPPHQRPLAVGTLITFTGVGQALGPTVGGLITQYLSWRYAFFINLPICLVSFLLVYLYCNLPRTNTEKKSIHWRSALLLALGLVLMTVALNQSSSWGLQSVKFWLTFVLAILLLVIMVMRQFQVKEPLINLNIYRNPTYRLITLIRFFFQLVFSATIFIIPLYLQNILGFTPVISGLIILSSTFFMAISGPLTGRLINYVGTQKLVTTAMFICCVSLVLLLISGNPVDWITFIAGLSLFGIFSGMMFSTTNYIAVNAVAEHQRGMGYSTFVTVAFYSAALGVALSSAIISFLSHFRLTQLITSTRLTQHSAELTHVASGARMLSGMQHLLPTQLYQAAKNVVIQSFTYGYHGLLIVFLVAAILALLLSLKLQDCHHHE